jgi:hypothetical protein
MLCLVQTSAELLFILPKSMVVNYPLTIDIFNNGFIHNHFLFHFRGIGYI